jgi:adenylosuccinate synthase
MKLFAVVGSSYGDEGKGRVLSDIYNVLDSLSLNYIGIRYNGGPNAGHTVYTKSPVTQRLEKVILHQVPVSCAFGKTGYIANTCVVDLDKLLSEAETLQSILGFIPEILLDSRATVITKQHIALDDKPFTTGQGIGPAYAARANREALTVYEYLIIHNLIPLSTKNKILSFIKLAKPEDFFQGLDSYNGYVFAEGAQALGLSPESETYPYSTAYSCNPAVIYSAGMSLKHSFKTILVSKPYETRSGSDPNFISYPSSISDSFQRIGNEFGSTTGRKRYCGPFNRYRFAQSVYQTDPVLVVFNKCDVYQEILGKFPYESFKQDMINILSPRFLIFNEGLDTSNSNLEIIKALFV